MCGIVGAVAQRDVQIILLEGLRRLEYRGYDSAGIAVAGTDGNLTRVRRAGKVAALAEALAANPLVGQIGLAHTRWATHGAPTEVNAHPHFSSPRIGLVHNGIIENYQELKASLMERGVKFESDTDTEVAAHLIHQILNDSGGSLADAVAAAAKKLRGAYALAVIDKENPDQIVGARQGSPLVLGIGLGEHFLASDVGALLPVTQRFVFLNEGDLVVARRNDYQIFDASGEKVTRKVSVSQLSADASEKGEFRHFMQKEIHEQAEAIANTLEGRITETGLSTNLFSQPTDDLLSEISSVHIVACGTSFHAALVSKYWIEELARFPCSVEISSEFRYRQCAIPDNTLFICISQSGETADTLAALNLAKSLGYKATLAICNVPESSIVRAADIVLMTRAGTEIGVASTKAFTTQLVALFVLTLFLAREQLDPEDMALYAEQLRKLPKQVGDALELETEIKNMAMDFVEKDHALFLGRGPEFPIALEGALKLKEISYIHAEGYAAGELKHGPLALVDENMPVVVSAASNDVVEKLVSNLQEVKARGGQLYVFADADVDIPEKEYVRVIRLPESAKALSPVLHTIPLQLLAYHVAIQRGTDVDQPRNLAKSVTVE